MDSKVLRLLMAVLFFAGLSYVRTGYTTVILFEDFEYGQDSTACSNTTTLPNFKWNYCISTNGNLNISSTHAHSGSRSLQYTKFAPDGTYSDIFLEKDRLNLGTDIWVEEWIYPAYEPGMYSTFGSNSKWVYAYPMPNTPNYRGQWCVKFTGNDRINLSNGQVFQPLSNNHTGLFFFFDGMGCAQWPADTRGQNRPVGEEYIHYAPVNQWTRLIFHVNMSNAVSPNIEMWMDHGSGLVKVLERTTTWTFAEGISTDRIKLGTTIENQSWIFIDDVKIATSSSDINWPPSAPYLNPPQ